MNKSALIVLLMSVLGLLSCKKEKIPDPQETGTPVFSVKGTIGADSIRMMAGDDGFFMSTYKLSVNGVEQFCGKLDNGLGSFEIGIFNGDLDISSLTVLDHLQQPINFAAIPQAPLAVLSRELFPNQAVIQEIKWFVNGQFSGINEAEILMPGKYNVCASVTYVDGETINVCNEMILGYKKNATCKLRHFMTQAGELIAWVDEESVPVSSVKWYVDNELVSENEKLELDVNENLHLVRAEITFTNGAKRIKTVVADGEIQGRFLDDFSLLENSQPCELWDYAVTVTVKHNNGIYQSVNTDNHGSQFTVTAVDYYGKNAAGKNVFKVTGILDAALRRQGTSQILPLHCALDFGIEIDQ